MAVPRCGRLFVAALMVSLPACATVPSPPSKEAPRVERSKDPLGEAMRKSQEDARRFERDGRFRESLDRWTIVLTIEPQQVEAKQKIQELEGKVREEARRHIAAGKEQVQRHKKEAAQREFLAALRLDPLNREALEQLYQSEEQLGEQAAFAKPPRRGGATGKIQAEVDAKAKAMPDEEVQEEEESGEEVSFAEAAELFRQGDYLAAIDAFTRVLAKQPGMREAAEYQKLAFYNQGLAYMKTENYADALKLFEQLRKMQPDFKRLGQNMQTAREKLADQHNLAGIRNFREQKLQEAIREWDQAIALNPKLESARRSQERAKKLLKSLDEIK